MRIELYKLKKDPTTFSLGARIEAVLNAPLKSRNRQRGADFIRLETHEKRDQLWFCDFVRLRMNHGPSKAGLSQPAKGFDLSADEGFGEETAFLWDASNDWCVVQYNHHGVRPAAIAEYLGLFVHTDPVLLELMPKLDEKIHAKLRAKKLVTKVSLSVAPKELSDDDFDLGGGLGAAAKALKRSDAERIEITVSAPARRGLNFSLLDFASWLKRLGATSEDSPVTAARATARESVEDEPEVLDLLKHRIISEAEMTPGIDKRYPVKDRWDALHRAHTSWKHLMI